MRNNRDVLKIEMSGFYINQFIKSNGVTASGVLCAFLATTPQKGCSEAKEDSEKGIR